MIFLNTDVSPVKIVLYRPIKMSKDIHVSFLFLLTIKKIDDYFLISTAYKTKAILATVSNNLCTPSFLSAEHSKNSKAPISLFILCP